MPLGTLRSKDFGANFLPSGLAKGTSLAEEVPKVYRAMLHVYAGQTTRIVFVYTHIYIRENDIIEL